MRGFSAALLLLAFSAAATPPADSLPAPGNGVTLRLTSGQELSGVFLRRGGPEIWLGIDQGEIGVDATEILQIQARANDDSEFHKRFGALPSGDAEAAWRLAVWARDTGLHASARLAARRALATDPDHAQARKLLGEEKLNGTWMSDDDAKRTRGYLQDEDGRWVTKEQLSELVEKRAAAARAQSERDRAHKSQPKRPEEQHASAVTTIRQYLPGNALKLAPAKKERAAPLVYTQPLYPGAQPFLTQDRLLMRAEPGRSYGSMPMFDTNHFLKRARVDP